MGKKKDKNKSAKDDNETAATAATDTKETKTGEMKLGQTFSEEIQAPKNVHNSVTKLPATKQGLRSTEDVKVGEKSSHIQEAFMTDEEAEELFKDLEKVLTFYKSVHQYTPLGARRASSAQYQDRTNSILDDNPNLSRLLKFYHGEFFKNAVRRISLNEKNVDRLWNIFFSSCEVSETVVKSKKFHVMKVIKAVNETKTPNAAEIFDTYFREKDSSSVDDTQKPTCLPQELTKKKECKKGDGFSGDIQAKPLCPYKTELECNDETQLKNPDSRKEIKGKAKDGEEMKHKIKKGNLCAGHTKPSEISKLGILRNLNKYTDLMRSGSDTDLEMHQKFQPPLNIKGTEDTYFEEKGIKTDTEELEVIKASKEEAYKTNDLIMQLKKVEYKKGKDSKALEDTKASKEEEEEINDSIRHLQKVEENEKEKDAVALEVSKEEEELLNDYIMHLQRVAEKLEAIKASEAAEEFKYLIMQLKQIEVNKKQNDAKSFEGKEALKKVDDRIYDLLRQFKKFVEYRKENACGSSADYKEAAAKIPLTTTDDRNEKEKGEEDVERSNEGIQDLRLNKGIISQKQEMEYGIRKNYMDDTIRPEKTKILPAGDFNPHREGIISQLKSRSDEKRNFFSLGTEPIAAAAKTKSHDKTKDITGIKYDDLHEVLVPAASYKPKEVVIDLKQTEDIHFHFDTDNDMKILVGDKDYQLKENQDITFSCKEENVTVSFTGKQISVSTPSSEFDISIRKSDPVDLTDKATKTDDLM